ncbi:hypothetical protein GR268_46885, partial [Rhizobium leguminosarum]|nr:hypothetical protein [Rhizobium leguminosarum]
VTSELKIWTDLVAIGNLNSLFNAENILKVKQAISDELLLFENLNKQAELKEKGTKK